MIQVPNIRKKDYTVVDVNHDGSITLLDDDTCKVRHDLQLKKDSDIARSLLDKFKEGDVQIKVTVLKALDEEQIMAFKTID